VIEVKMARFRGDNGNPDDTAGFRGDNGNPDDTALGSRRRGVPGTRPE
jgi:hypothetical protein